MYHKPYIHFLHRPLTIVILLAFLVSTGAAAQSVSPPIEGPRIVASEAGDWLWTVGFNQTDLAIAIFASDGEGAATLWSGSAPADEGGFAFVGIDVHALDLVPGNFITVTDGTTAKGLVLESISMSVFDTANDVMAGTAPLGREVWAFAGPQDWQEPLMAAVDPATGDWYADFSTVPFDITVDMQPWSYAHIYDADGDANEAGTPPLESNPFHDDFDGALAAGWEWQNENPAKWNLTDSPGFLRIYASPGGSGEENLLLHPVSAGDFTVETHLIFEPYSNFNIAGIYLYGGDGNSVTLGRAFCDVPDACVGNGIYFDAVVGGEWYGPNFATAVDTPNEAWLRMERRGEMVRGLYSADGVYWVEIGTHWMPTDVQFTAVGLTNAQNIFAPENPVPADFDYFEMTEGWGFLPEGYHDYFEGEVASWDCNAGGWTVDPDDRAADLTVAVAVDGTVIYDGLVADQYRPDLEESGGCDGGSCGFNTSLWDAIVTYETHDISVFARDNAVEKWVRLSASPKQLTCRTYDIYAFDPLTGEVQQVSNLRNADEYNPSWSPNGKLVAHDVASGEIPQGIYLTSPQTGVSALLVGAENGNDAVWSPNGKQIAFDRDSNIYLVPAEGGTATPVREDAVSASWAPNGKRLVFMQPSDGSIMTVPLAGDKGAETLIVPQGQNPEWSPDGNWIVYEFNGDIWKVPVNILGVVLGDPVQVTSLVAWEGQPTWSRDSQTIIYHAGLNTDWDLWSVPAAGGEPVWLNGAPMLGDYDPAFARDRDLIAYASASPNGQAPRTWVAAYTYDFPSEFWTEGSHTYQFFAEGVDPTEPREFNVSINNPRFNGIALLRPGGIRLQLDGECVFLDGINPSQPTQLNVGWIFDGSFADAQAYLNPLMSTAVWDGGDPVLLQRHEILPFTPGVDWIGYICAYSAGPPKMDLRVNYGANWVESFYEGGHQVDLTVTDDVGTVKGTATVFTGPREEWGGEEGFQTTELDWSSGPPDILPNDWVFAVVDNGVTAKVQIGEINGTVSAAEDLVTGTILAPWIDRAVQVECLDWGSGQNPPYGNVYSGPISPDGVAEYSCSWSGVWDVQPWQDIGVGYFTPDGHWVATAFRFES